MMPTCHTFDTVFAANNTVVPIPVQMELLGNNSNKVQNLPKSRHVGCQKLTPRVPLLYRCGLYKNLRCTIASIYCMPMQDPSPSGQRSFHPSPLSAVNQCVEQGGPSPASSGLGSIQQGQKRIIRTARTRAFFLKHFAIFQVFALFRLHFRCSQTAPKHEKSASAHFCKRCTGTYIP